MQNGNMKWSSGTFQHILNNECYATGKSYYKGIPFEVPKIVDTAKWDKVQQLKKQRSNKHLKVSKYLLGGLVKCALCGSPISGELGKGVRYYRCNNRHRTFPLPRTCNAKMVTADTFENVVWNRVNYLLEHYDILQQRIDYLNRDDKDLEKLLNEEKKSLDKKLSVIEKKKNRFLDLFGEEQLSKKQLLSKISGIEEEESVLKEQLKGITIRVAAIAQKPTIIKSAKEFCKLARVQMGLLTFEEKQEFLRMIIKEIKYNSITREVFIDGYIPLDSFTKSLGEMTRDMVAVGIKNPSYLSNELCPNFLVFKERVLV